MYIPIDDEIYDSLARLHLADIKHKEQIAFMRLELDAALSCINTMMETQEILIKRLNVQAKSIAALSNGNTRLDRFSELN